MIDGAFYDYPRSNMCRHMQMTVRYWWGWWCLNSYCLLPYWYDDMMNWRWSWCMTTQSRHDQWQSRQDMTSCIAEVWPTERYTYSYEDLDDELTLMSVDLISSIDGKTMQSCSSEEWWASKEDEQQILTRDWWVALSPWNISDLGCSRNNRTSQVYYSS